MTARRIVLLLGFLIVLVGFAAVVLGALVLFVPGFDIVKGTRPIVQIIYFMAIGIGACFVGIIFAVAGANTKKGLARLAFFLGTVAFITGAALLIISLFFNTILPIQAIENLHA